MRFALLLVGVWSASAQTVIRFDPPVVTHCAVGAMGSGTISWNYPGPGPVEVRIGSVDGAALTRRVSPQGSIVTGDWVTDGMVFVLTDGGTQELARSNAVVVRCNTAGEVLAPALATASYFPLQVGDEWIYSYSSRGITSSYVTRRIVRADLIADVVWFVMDDGSMYRNDDMGRIYQLTSQGEQLWLDPSTPPDRSAVLTITGRGAAVQVPAGLFQDSLNYSVPHNIYDFETGTFARGIGLVKNSHLAVTGSSGGFNGGMTLVYAKIDGHIVFASPANALELATEASSFDVTNQQTANCAVPCYFTACGLGPGADPPGTYKPCFQARVRLGQTGSELQSCDLDLLDSSNNNVFHATLSGTSDGVSTLAIQVPLYSVSPSPPYPPVIQLFPPGSYQLRAQTPDGRISIAPVQLK